MNIKEMIKKVTAEEIVATAIVKKQVEVMAPGTHLIMIAFDN